MTEEYTLPLADPRATLENAGGKGASLARLADAGLPVPDGFHVTTEAYRRFVDDNSLQPAILEALADVSLSQPSTLETASLAIADLFAHAPMPRGAADAIARAYAELPGEDPAVAVRSSATTEDLPGISFAGQHETYLNVRGEAGVLDAVKRCWASLWTARAIGYRLKMGVDQRWLSMGVVVQTMVRSDVAGVLFTANPTTGEREELVVSASCGPGEAVVSGRVTPDSLVVDKASLVVKEAVLGAKEVAILPSGEQGTVMKAVPDGRQGEPALSERGVRELGEMAIQVEKLFEGVPQDIEWAVAGGRCWLLQARPMTGLPPAPLKDVRWEPPIPGTKWVRSIAMPRSGLSSALFLRGFPSKALEAEAELQAIAEQVRASDDLRELVVSTPAQRLLDALKASPSGSVVVERLQRYLDRYGHQVYNLDFAEPTQAEAPMPVLLSLKAQVQGAENEPPLPMGEGRCEGSITADRESPHPNPLPPQWERELGVSHREGELGYPSSSSSRKDAREVGLDAAANQAEMARERESLVEKTARSLDPLRRRIFLKMLRWAQGLAPYREEALFYIGSAWPALRRLALELGRRLVAAGSLHAPDDVFYLETGELLAASEARAAGHARKDLARLAQERRELREARKRLHPPAAVPPAARWKFGPIDLSGFETQKRNVDQGPTLRGFSVSPGRVTAPASVILSPADFDKMVPDTILVCPTTNPAWTPLFAQARGLVTDIGGVAAHGSIVAREYGIPAVMGTGVATCRIHSGDTITVDGSAGVVTLPNGGKEQQPHPLSSAGSYRR